MCGVFGFIGEAGQGPNMERLAAIARVTEQRGRHAFGFAWIDAAGRLRSFKQTGRISEHLPLLRMLEGARMIVGHCRYATQGDYHNNLNNHPHACDGGWIVHNGMVANYAKLIAERDLHMVTDCDSEAIALMMETTPGTLLERAAATMPELGPAVVLGLWNRPARLLVARCGNPLHLGSTVRGMYLASLADGLPKNAKAVSDGTATLYRFDREGVIDFRTTECENRTNEEDEDGDEGAACGSEEPIWKQLRKFKC